MRHRLLLPLLLAACQATPSGSPPSFPDSWVGAWRGELRIFGSTGTTPNVHMEVHVAKVAQGFQWKIIYGTGPDRQVRDYILRAVNAGRGEYEIDERNSIALPATYRAGTLISKFAIGNNAILSTYRRAGDVILFELFTGPRTSARTSGGRGTPVVEGYNVLTRQMAVLHKVE